MKHDNDYYLREAAPASAIAHMCVPLLAAMGVSTLATLVDAFFVGQLGDTAALAAVALALPFTTALMAVGDLLGTGGSTFIARLLGAGKPGEAKRVSATNHVLAFAFGLVAAVLSIVFLEPLSTLLGAGGETLAPTMTYLGILAAGAPLSVLGFVLDQDVRAEGAAKASMIGTIISAGANLVFDPIFIFGFGWGVAGAALATASSWLISAVYLVVYVKRSGTQSVSPKDATFRLPVLKEILGVGFSAFAMTLLMTVSAWVLDVLAAGYSSAAVAGIGIGFRVSMFAGLFTIAATVGVIPLIGYAYAAGNGARIKALVKTVALILAALLAVAGAALLVFGRPLVGLFSNDPAVVEVGMFALFALVAGVFVSSASELILGMLQALGRAMPASVVSVARGVITIALYVAGNALFAFAGLVLAGVVSEALALLVALAFVPYLVKKVRGIGNGEGAAAVLGEGALPVDGKEPDASAPILVTPVLDV